MQVKRWWLCSALALGTLSACDKQMIDENTRPASTGAPGPAPSLDGGFSLMDAGVLSDGAVVEPNIPFTKAGLLTAIADCALARYRIFDGQARALRDATRAWAEQPTDEQRLAAQAAWRVAMNTWQELELFRFGPAGSSAEPGGRDLRNPIYFFPDINNCLVDQSIVNLTYTQRPLSLSVSAKGLGALEYLLFYAGNANSCAQSVTINANGSWAALAPEELTRRRAAYAGAIGEDLAAQAAALVTAWDPARGNFHTLFAQAGGNRQLFATDQDAFNVVDNALFYFDKELKDLKVGFPLGVNPDCPGDTCPEAVESRYALASNANIAANISGFRLIFQGCGPGYTGLGFDDWLRAIGRDDLATRINAAADGAARAVQGLTQPLEPLLAADRAQVQRLYDALKAVSDPLKADLTSALNLEPPMSVQGDND